MHEVWLLVCPRHSRVPEMSRGLRVVQFVQVWLGIEAVPEMRLVVRELGYRVIAAVSVLITK
jgi:hypothetical protein